MSGDNWMKEVEEETEETAPYLAKTWDWEKLSGMDWIGVGLHLTTSRIWLTMVSGLKKWNLKKWLLKKNTITFFSFSPLSLV